MSYLRVKYIKAYSSFAGNRAEWDSWVLPYQNGNMNLAVDNIFTTGFTRPSIMGLEPFDPEEIIAPSAILSVTPCDWLGYSIWDKEKNKQKQK